MAGVMPVIGDVAAMRLPGGGYGACQVTGIGKDVVTACALAWYSEDQPDVRQLAGAGPLILDHHAHQGNPAQSTSAGVSHPARLGMAGSPAGPGGSVG